MEVATARNNCHPYGWCGRAREGQGRKEVIKTQELRGEDLGGWGPDLGGGHLAERCWGL